MQEVGPLVCLIIFFLLTILFGVFAHGSYVELYGEDPEGMPEQTLDYKIEELKGTLVTESSAIKLSQERYEKERDRIAILRSKKEKLEELEYLYRTAYQRRLAYVRDGDQFQQQAIALKGKIDEAKRKTESNVREDESRIRVETETQVQKASEAKEQLINLQYRDREAILRDETDYKRNKNVDESHLSEVKRQLKALTDKDPVRSDIADVPDGKVIMSAPLQDLVVINLGTSHGVRNGWRFEVYRLRPGNIKEVKGYIEVKKATPTMSECFIITRIGSMPKDPLSEYVAEQEEEKFSPYHRSGTKGTAAQGLTARTPLMSLGKKVLDPIVMDDLIQNPFFDKDKRLTFYIAGNKDIVDGQQKGAVAYTWPHIKRIAEFYGANVRTDRVSMDVDYVIAQKLPKEDEDPEYQAAINFGIPLVYEWQLFRFLDQR